MISEALKNKLKILDPYLKTKGLIELSINEPYKVWLETAAKGWTLKKDKKLSLSALETLSRLLATESGQTFSLEVPLLSLHLPSYGFRMQVVGGASVDSGFCLSIRAAAVANAQLSDYFSKDDVNLIKELVESKKNILISGGTSSGKTTLLNTIIKEISEDVRIITIEDVKELIINQPNNIRLIKSKTNSDIGKVSYEDLINASLRLRPDRLLLGEIDIENTTRFLKILNTGHAGTLSTIHANSSQGAIDALIMNTKLTGFNSDDETIRKFVTHYLDYVIQVKRVNRKSFNTTITKI